MVRYGEMIGVKPEKLAEYKYHHAHAWAEVNAMIRECNIRNYSIFSKGVKKLKCRLMKQVSGIIFPLIFYMSTKAGDYAAL